MSWLNARNELPSSPPPNAKMRFEVLAGRVCPSTKVVPGMLDAAFAEALRAARRSRAGLLLGADVGVALDARGGRVDIGQGSAGRAHAPQPAGGVPRPVSYLRRSRSGRVVTVAAARRWPFLHATDLGVRFWCHCCSRAADVSSDSNDLHASRGSRTRRTGGGCAVVFRMTRNRCLRRDVQRACRSSTPDRSAKSGPAAHVSRLAVQQSCCWH